MFGRDEPLALTDESSSPCAGDREIDREVDYYESKHVGLGIEFEQEIEAALSMISRFPEIGARSTSGHARFDRSAVSNLPSRGAQAGAIATRLPRANLAAKRVGKSLPPSLGLMWCSEFRDLVMVWLSAAQTGSPFGQLEFDWRIVDFPFCSSAVVVSRRDYHGRAHVAFAIRCFAHRNKHDRKWRAQHARVQVRSGYGGTGSVVGKCTDEQGSHFAKNQRKPPHSQARHHRRRSVRASVITTTRTDRLCHQSLARAK